MEHYSAHHDFFDPAAYASNPEMLASVEHGAKNRLATVFFYLNNVTNEEDVSKGGGQTNFPRAATKEFPNGGPQPRDYFDCSKGLSVYPQEGKVRAAAGRVAACALSTARPLSSMISIGIERDRLDRLKSTACGPDSIR